MLAIMNALQPILIAGVAAALERDDVKAALQKLVSGEVAKMILEESGTA